MQLALLLAAALARPFTACAHALDSPRPRLTLAEQQETRRLIHGAVVALGGSTDFAALLELVATRESSLQRGLVHRLTADQDAVAAAWRRLGPRYQGNRFLADAGRWQTFGLFGMSSPIFTQVWDTTADPRVLCDAVVDVLVYQRAAQRIVAKLRRTSACAPTWANIHAGVSSGKLCPLPARLADFRRRAARAGFDPDRVVTAADLGRSPSRGEQLAELARLRLLTWRAR